MKEMKRNEMENASRLLSRLPQYAVGLNSNKEKKSILSKLCGLELHLKCPKNKFCWRKD